MGSFDHGDCPGSRIQARYVACALNRDIDPIGNEIHRCQQGTATAAIQVQDRGGVACAIDNRRRGVPEKVDLVVPGVDGYELGKLWGEV